MLKRVLNNHSLILVIRPKFGFPLRVYSDVVIKIKLYCLLVTSNSR